jgi:hypothetical protein
MTAPLGQRVRCAISGHDWRRAIGPREGYYLRCRRCCISEQVDEMAHSEEAHASQGWQHAQLHPHA